VCVAPLLAAAPLFARTGTGLSLLEYGGGAPAAVAERRELRLEPSAPELALDLYRGRGSSPRPLVVVVHGGSWQGGDKGEAGHVSRFLAARGFTVADLRYRLAPRHRSPASVADVKCLLGRLRERAQELALDPRRVALLGRSAGGQIALVAAYSAGDPRLAPSCPVPDAPVQAVVSIYAPTDLAWGYENPSVPDVIHGPRSLETYLGGSPRDFAEAYRLGTPQSWLDREVPPTLLIHGEADRLVRAEHARRLARALLAARGRVELLLVPFADHGFDRRSGGIGEQLARAEILRFLTALPAP
jgi:acetyl esterase/lipase